MRILKNTFIPLILLTSSITSARSADPILARCFQILEVTLKYPNQSPLVPNPKLTDAQLAKATEQWMHTCAAIIMKGKNYNVPEKENQTENQ